MVHGGLLVQPGSVTSPHPITNIRKIQHDLRSDETNAERRLRLALDDDYEFHHDFWMTNNEAFKQAKDAFFATLPADCDQYNVPPHLMAKFYRQFMEEHWREQLHYNMGWWLRSCRQIPLYFLAYMSRIAKFS
eukprot:m.20175 g.20175  ORF g.20175 m.20175 type:complete len:133 (+) comp5223_c0_seq1:135-533(+)